MKKRWNNGWLFAEAEMDLPFEKTDALAWERVTLPHDFLFSDAQRLYRSADGWYQKTLEVTPDEAEGAVEVWFDGVYQDASVYLNGEHVLDHHYGYTAFCADLTGRVRPGQNILRVVARHRDPCSRWYSGAGIFRDVTLVIRPKARLVKDGVYFHADRGTDGSWRIHSSAETVLAQEGGEVRFTLLSPDGRLCAEGVGRLKGNRAVWETEVKDVRCWDIAHPEVYRLQVTFGGETEECGVGFRETRFTPDKGFFLNGKRVKLRGVCPHHDLGALGAAFHEKALRRQLLVMKEMGANAVRTSHNPPARQFMDLCDEMGLLVVSELYDMWEMPKTAYDHARFFVQDHASDTASWVRRDRNHPSLILWSIGNEIPDMHHSDRGAYWTKVLGEEAASHDPLGNGRVTFGSNYMPWEGAQKCAGINGIPGYNYAEKYYAPHHRAHPGWVIYGSETASVLQSRGIYHFPKEEDLLSDEDLQCSALGNSKTSWGSQDAEKMLREEEERAFTLGQFIWSGVDYIGEPTPYHTRSCYFGQADTACFPKDSWYLYRAAWSGKDTVHIGVSWDWNIGQQIDVPVWTNMDEVELFLNGRSLGTRKRGKGYSCVWTVPYREGTLLAVGRGPDGKTAEDRRQSFSDSRRLRLEWDGAPLMADGEDMAFLTVCALDERGAAVENAVDRVKVSLEGPGTILGMDNGDSTDPDGYRVSSRRLFSGRLLIIVGALGEAGTITVKVTSPDLEGDSVSIPVLPAAGKEIAQRIPFRLEEPSGTGEKEVRKILLTRLDGGALTPEHDTALFGVRCLPEGSAFPLSFRMANRAGISLPYAGVLRDGDRVRVRASGDGRMILRASCANGDTHPRILSQMELEARGFGKAALDPYGFISAGLYDLHFGEITPGNEQGIAFSRDEESMVGFSNVDLGRDGSDEITLPVFALDDREYRIRLTDGDPRQGGKEIAELPYRKKSIWNVYQEETWRLPVRLKGTHTLCFSLGEKVHLKGFSFTRQPRTGRAVCAAEADRIYGDSFCLEKEAVKGIGNNVTLSFEEMDLREGGEAELLLEGATPLDQAPIALRIRDSAGAETVTMLPFDGGDGQRRSLSFPVTLPGGLAGLSFVFLPGCRFDFYRFRIVFPQKKEGSA